MQTQERFNGRGWRVGDNHKRDLAFQEDEIGPLSLKKNVRDDDCDGEGLRCWRSVNDDRAEDDANDEDIVERGATAADDGDDGGNGKEDRVDNNDGKGEVDDWRDVDLDNDGSSVASLFPCLPNIIV